MGDSQVQPVLNAIVDTVTSLAACRLVSEAAFAPRLSLRLLSKSWISLGSAAFLSLQIARAAWNKAVPQIQQSSLALKLTLLTIGHTGACALDTWAHTSRWRCTAFGRCLLRSTAYVAPAYPLLIIFGSTLLMLITSMSQLVGVSHSSVHYIVDLGSLHGPFFFVHVHTRRAMMAAGAAGMSLPLHSSASSAGESYGKSQESLRRHRVMHFLPGAGRGEKNLST